VYFNVTREYIRYLFSGKERTILRFFLLHITAKEWAIAFTGILPLLDNFSRTPRSDFFLRRKRIRFRFREESAAALLNGIRSCPRSCLRTSWARRSRCRRKRGYWCLTAWSARSRVSQRPWPGPSCARLPVSSRDSLAVDPGWGVVRTRPCTDERNNRVARLSTTTVRYRGNPRRVRVSCTRSSDRPDRSSIASVAVAAIDLVLPVPVSCDASPFRRRPSRWTRWCWRRRDDDDAPSSSLPEPSFQSHRGELCPPRVSSFAVETTRARACRPAGPPRADHRPPPVPGARPSRPDRACSSPLPGSPDRHHRHPGSHRRNTSARHGPTWTIGWTHRRHRRRAPVSAACCDDSRCDEKSLPTPSLGRDSTLSLEDRDSARRSSIQQRPVSRWIPARFQASKLHLATSARRHVGARKLVKIASRRKMERRFERTSKERE